MDNPHPPSLEIPLCQMLAASTTELITCEVLG